MFFSRFLHHYTIIIIIIITYIRVEMTYLHILTDIHILTPQLLLLSLFIREYQEDFYKPLLQW